jgi:hypothetical protein
MEQSLQKDEMYLPGDLGSIRDHFTGMTLPIKSIFHGKDGTHTITVTVYPEVQCPVAHLVEQPSCELAGKGFESLPDNQNLLT